MQILPISPQTSRNEPLRAVAEKLEAQFLSEMLKSARLDAAPSPFGGGAGEDQFASFLRQAQAEKMAETGGIGLAETIFQSLVKRSEAGE